MSHHGNNCPHPHPCLLWNFLGSALIRALTLKSPRITHQIILLTSFFPPLQTDRSRSLQMRPSLPGAFLGCDVSLRGEDSCVSAVCPSGKTTPSRWPQHRPPPIPQSLAVGSDQNELFNFSWVLQTSACCVTPCRELSLHCCLLECQTCGSEKKKPQ